MISMTGCSPAYASPTTAAEDTPAARTALMGRFELSERQAQAILDMRLRSLTALERQKVLDELEELRARIAELREPVEERAIWAQSLHPD